MYDSLKSNQTYLSTSDFFPSTVRKSWKSFCQKGRFCGPGSTWLPFVVFKLLGLSVAACDENLGPAGSDLDRYDSARYHHDPRASHRRHRRPCFKRCAPLGLWQRSSSRTLQMHSTRPSALLDRVLRNLAAASRPRLPSARRSIRFCRPCLPLSVAWHSSSAGEEVILLAGKHTLHVAGWQPMKILPISKPS